MRHSLFPASGAAHKNIIFSLGGMSLQGANKMPKKLDLTIITNKIIYMPADLNDECL
jgi:hypothetical protein